MPTGELENYGPAFLQQSSLTSSESEDDDGFLELLDEQDLKVGTKEMCCSSKLSSVYCGVCSTCTFWW